MDSVAPAVRTMTKWAEQCSADTGVASWMAGRRRRPQEENTDNILSSQATARMSLRDDRTNIVTVINLVILECFLNYLNYELNQIKHKNVYKHSKHLPPAPCSSDHWAGQQRVPVSSVSGTSQLTELRTRDHRHLVLHLQEHRRLHAHLHTHIHNLECVTNSLNPTECMFFSPENWNVHMQQETDREDWIPERQTLKIKYREHECYLQTERLLCAWCW